MKRIRKNSEIKIGDTIVYEEITTGFFIAKKTVLIITSHDSSGDFWCTPKRRQLSDIWKKYKDICIGNANQDCCRFYKK